jgi:4-phosphopantoate---beta-alanine ligase
MTQISRSHPRYRSLVTRARLAEDLRSGLVAPEGLIAHGRAEAFDYLLGERTSASAEKAIRRAADWLVVARAPAVSVNGNVAALAAPEIAQLVKVLPGLKVEINLFHRTPARVAQIARRLRAAGVRMVYGVRPTARIPGLPSDRSLVDRRGILLADLVVVPLEDGDRTEALRRLGKRVISIDLNPLSRTNLSADLPIIDELVRALKLLAHAIPRARREAHRGEFRDFNAESARSAALATISHHLDTATGRRPPRAGRSRRAPPRDRRRRSEGDHRTSRTP